MLIISGLREFLWFQFAILAMIAFLSIVSRCSWHRGLHVGLEVLLPLCFRLLLFEIYHSCFNGCLIGIISDAIQLVEVLMAIFRAEHLFCGAIILAALHWLLILFAALLVLLKPLVNWQQFYDDGVSIECSVHLADAFDLNIDVKLWDRDEGPAFVLCARPHSSLPQLA